MIDRKKTIFFTYNLYKGGSLRLLNAITKAIENDPMIRVLSPIYPVTYLNNIWRLILDQFFVPFMLIFSRKIVLFGNVPSVLYFGKQVVLIHNPNYWRLDWRKISIRNKFEYYYFYISNSIAIKFLKVRYVTQIDYIENEFRKIFPKANVKTIGSPFDENEFQELVERASGVQIKDDIIHMSNYLYYPAYFYESKNHKILSIASAKIKRNHGINLVCSNAGGLVGLGGYKNLSSEENLFLLKRCQGLIFPSEFETFGYPLVESAFLGKPIIALNKEYVNSLVGNIYLFENTVDSLLEAIKIYVEDCNNQCVKTPFIKIDINPKNFVGSLMMD